MTDVMIHRRAWLPRIVAATLMLAASMTSVDAQPAASLSEAATQVEAGEKVRILRSDGSEVLGELRHIEATFLEVDTDGQRVRVGAADVRDIGVKDGVYNGLLIGLGVGLAAGTAIGFAIVDSDKGNLEGLKGVLAQAVGAGVGMAVGARLDARSAHYKSVLGGAATVQVSPFAAPGRGYGAVVALRW